MAQPFRAQSAVLRIGAFDDKAVIAAVEFTAKDFRTWHGSVLALQLWRKLEIAEQLQPTAAQTNRLLTEVASQLGNTLAVCRKSYVHPRVLALLAGEPKSHKTSAGLTSSEQDFLALLAGSS